jgi:hypothetical protein
MLVNYLSRQPSTVIAEVQLDPVILALEKSHHGLQLIF